MPARKKAEFKEDFQELLRKGFMRARVDGKIIYLIDEIALDGIVAHDVDIVIDRLTVNQKIIHASPNRSRKPLNLGNGVCSVLDVETDEETPLFHARLFT